MKTLLVVFLILFSFSMFAQSPISKETIILNGSIYYSSQSYDNSSFAVSTLRINPQAGYFIIDNLALILDLSYEYIEFEFDLSRYGIGPNLRYYFDFETYFPFYSLGYSYTLETYYSNTLANGNSDYNRGHQFILGAGISFLITKNVSIEALINYKFDQVKRKHSGEIEKSKILMLGLGFNFYLY